MSNHKKRREPKSRIFVPQSILIGELIPWKGHFWRIVAGSPTGGEVALTDDEGKTTKGASQNTLLVLERGNETTKTLKRKIRTARWNKQHCQTK
jgi:hypothetical protein